MDKKMLLLWEPHYSKKWHWKRETEVQMCYVCVKRFVGGRRLAPEVLWKGYSAEKKDLCTTGKQV